MSKYMTESENSKCHAIIHSAAVATGAVGAGLAQIPLSDSLVIMPIQVGMVISLGNVFGKSLGEAAAKSIFASFAASFVGRSASQALLGWIPILGNAINASTAFTLTESIGWIIANNFAEEAAQAAKKAQEEAEARRRAEEAESRLREIKDEDNEVHSAYSLKTVLWQQCQTVVKIIKSVLSIPSRLLRVLVYVAVSIFGAVRGFFGWLFMLIIKPFTAIKIILSKIWGGICALLANLGNGFWISCGLAVAVVVIKVIAKYQLLSPEAIEWLNITAEVIGIIK